MSCILIGLGTSGYLGYALYKIRQIIKLNKDMVATTILVVHALVLGLWVLSELIFYSYLFYCYLLERKLWF
jgi:hypothetical protein